MPSPKFLELSGLQSPKFFDCFTDCWKFFAAYGPMVFCTVDLRRERLDQLVNIALSREYLKVFCCRFNNCSVRVAKLTTDVSFDTPLLIYKALEIAPMTSYLLRLQLLVLLLY